MRRTDHRDRADHPRVQHRRRPADQATVGVADQCRRRVAERTDQAGGVAGQRPAVVAAGRFVAAAVAAQVDGHDAGAGQAAQLMAPRPPERAESVQQDRPAVARSASCPLRRPGVRPPRRGTECRWRAPPDAATDRRCGPPTDRADVAMSPPAAPGHYQPDGSAVGLAAALPSLAVLLLASAEELSALALSPPGVSASGISLTVSMVFCGPRMRRTLR